jgi:hypothetical protein
MIPKYWSNGGDYTRLTIERVYFDRDRYIERRSIPRPRTAETYYDRHRAAKGDLYDVETLVTVHGMTAEQLQSALETAFGRAISQDDLWTWAKGAALGYQYGTPAERRPRRVTIPA